MHAPAASTLLRHPQLAPHAFSAAPAWLWAADGSRVVWANAAGAALFGAGRPSDLTSRRFEAHHPAGREVRRLTGALPASGAAQLARLRGFPPGLTGALTAAARRLALPAQNCILIAGIDPARPVLPLAERARRMLEDWTGALAFASDGSLLYAGADAVHELGGRTTLAALDAVALAETALTEGRAEGTTAIGPLRFEKLGGGDAVVILATLPSAVSPIVQLTTPAATFAGSEDDARASYLAAALDDAETRFVVRRHPLRFVWRIDADGRFSIDSGDFTAMAGEATIALMGRPWREVADALALDSSGQMARALAARDTFSGVPMEWPAIGGGRLPVVLSGLPVLDGDRRFKGYRGFGVCRDARAIAAAIAARREVLSAAPAAHNVVPLRADTAPERRPSLSPHERNAFQEIARALGAKFDAVEQGAALSPSSAFPALDPTDPFARSTEAEGRSAATSTLLAKAVLDRLPVGVLAYRGDELLLANRSFFEWTGYADLAALAAAGGLSALFAASVLPAAGHTETLTLRTVDGAARPVDARLLALPEGQGMVLVLGQRAGAEAGEVALTAARTEVRELKSVLDTATDGVLLVDAEGRILSANLSAEALFGYANDELSGVLLVDLFAPESRSSLGDYLSGLVRGGPAGLLSHGREVVGRVRGGGLIPLSMTMGRINEDPLRFCAVFRDLTPWKRAEEELHDARRAAADARVAKSDLIAKLSYELRTPLNTIIGFAELMMRERLGPLGDVRYRAYMADIHACGEQIMTLLDNLRDLSRIETGALDLAFTKVDLNAVMREGVAAMQPQANRERIIIRMALSPAPVAVVADAASLRQIVTSLLANAIALAGAGGQVIVSTALTDMGEAVMRVRETGSGMSESQVAQAMESAQGSDVDRAERPGVGLPLAKALAEANRARLRITSAANAGTLVEIVFPATRVLSE